jgi:hypothetical protein
MNPDASVHDWQHEQKDKPRDDDGILTASVVAIVFATLAAVSFAVDHSVTLSSSPAPPAHTKAR